MRLFVAMATVAMLVGCAAPKVRIQTTDSVPVFEYQQPLVVGVRKTVDARPELERKSDELNERPRPAVFDEQMVKYLRLSGVAARVLFDRFQDTAVDVVLAPTLTSFTSQESVDAKTAAALGIALIPLVNLAYMAANGPIADHVAHLAVDMQVQMKSGTRLVSVDKTATITKRLNDDQSIKIGQLEGNLLSDVLRELTERTVRIIAEQDRQKSASQ